MNTSFIDAARRWHRDQRGTISIVSVFAAMLLTMLLGMVMNVGRQVDGKIRMQNAADAAAYSGGVVIARGMNTLAFSNHLLCDVFAMTAFMREARDRNAQSYTPAILAAWSNVAPAFSASGFPKFERLGPAIAQKVPLEQQLVDTYSEWAAAASSQILPLMELILAEELIPQYQRAVVAAFPDIAQAAAMEVALRHGRPQNGRDEMRGVLWRTSGQPVGGVGEAVDRTLPAVDPVLDALPDQPRYLSTARRQRKSLAEQYLRDWNNEAMYVFDHDGKMSQFGALWRSFTCGQLKQLLEVEYPDSNLLHVIRTELDEVSDANSHLEQNFVFLGVAYWRKLPEILPRLFRNPTDNDAVTYAEVHLFVPRRRLVWLWHHPGRSRMPIGGVPGEFPDLPSPDEPAPGTSVGGGRWVVGRESVPTHWDLLNQHWTCRLAPATQPNLATILQTPPPVPGFEGVDLRLPNLAGLGSDEIGRISPH